MVNVYRFEVVAIGNGGLYRAPYVREIAAASLSEAYAIVLSGEAHAIVQLVRAGAGESRARYEGRIWN